jgi:hypothetical protein
MNVYIRFSVAATVKVAKTSRIVKPHTIGSVPHPFTKDHHTLLTPCHSSLHHFYCGITSSPSDIIRAPTSQGLMINNQTGAAKSKPDGLLV